MQMRILIQLLFRCSNLMGCCAYLAADIISNALRLLNILIYVDKNLLHNRCRINATLLKRKSHAFAFVKAILTRILSIAFLRYFLINAAQWLFQIYCIAHIILLKLI